MRNSRAYRQGRPGVRCPVKCGVGASAPRGAAPPDSLDTRPMDDDERRGNRWNALADGGRAAGLEVRQLRALVALVDHGSVTAAARALGVAQSTVSEALSALERALGACVLVRRRGAAGGALTPAGGALLPYARGVLAALEEGQAAVAAVARDARASVEVLANESVSTYLLPGALGALRRRWPHTRFAVTVGACP